jgi:deoxyribodipyrimidine photo-lyase
MADFDLGLVWFRRDLRVADHAALYHALIRCRRVLCTFIFDREILSPLPKNDRRVPFIHASPIELDKTLRDAGGGPDGAAWHAVARVSRTGSRMRRERGVHKSQL